uniref:BZIP domain-containing protein n=1 Tax=Globodera rostochiensis TaxID=31243 RepID=A0A914HL25_GLORO
MSRTEMICEDVNRNGVAMLNALDNDDHLLLLNCSDMCLDYGGGTALMSRAQMVCEDVNYDRMANAGGGGEAAAVHNPPPGEAYALMEFGGSLFCVPASAFAAAVRVPPQSQVWPSPPADFAVGVPLSQLQQDEVSVGPRLPSVRHGVGGLRHSVPQSPARPFVAECAASRGALCGQQQLSAAVIVSDAVSSITALPLIRPPPESIVLASSCAFSELTTTQRASGKNAAEFVCCAAQGVPRLYCSSSSSSSSLSTDGPPSSSSSPPSASSHPPSPSPPPPTSYSSSRSFCSSSSPSSSASSFLSSSAPSPLRSTCVKPSSPPLPWQLWIDEMIREVQAEMFRAGCLSNDCSNFSSSRKRSFCSASPCSTTSSSTSGLISLDDSSSCSTSNSSGSPRPFPSSCSSQTSQPHAKRAKKNSLLTLSHEALAERKKEQNRAAAQRYRSRKLHLLEHEREEVWQLETGNAQMRAEMAQVAEQIAKLRAQLLLRK